MKFINTRLSHMVPWIAAASISLAPLFSASVASAAAVVYPVGNNLTADEKSWDYQVWVDGQEIYCYKSFAFTPVQPETTKPAGGGRPVSNLTFCSFDFSGVVTVKVKFGQSLRDRGIDTTVVDVRPLYSGINPPVVNDEITFTLDSNSPCMQTSKPRAANSPCQLSIEPGMQTRRPLHLFANPLETGVPDETNTTYVKVMNPNTAADPYHTTAEMALSSTQHTLYFKPGVHMVDQIPVTKHGTTIYVAGGAVVYYRRQSASGYAHIGLGPQTHTYAYINPIIKTNGLNNIKIRGRGILSGRRLLEGSSTEFQRTVLVQLAWGTNISVEGVTIVEPTNYGLAITNGNGANVNNVKVIGHFVNSDAIVIGGTSNAVVQDSFAHNADDSMEVKGWISQNTVEFKNCVVWNDVGGSFGLFGEIAANATVSGVTFRDSAVIHSLNTDSAAPVLGVRLAEPGHVSNFTFSNIIVEHAVGSKRAPLKVVNNWDAWNNNAYTTSAQDPYLPIIDTTTQAGQEKASAIASNGTISNVQFTDIHVLDTVNDDVVVEAADADSNINGVSFDTVSINGSALMNSSYPGLYTNNGQWVSNMSIAWNP